MPTGGSERTGLGPGSGAPTRCAHLTFLESQDPSVPLWDGRLSGGFRESPHWASGWAALASPPCNGGPAGGLVGVPPT